MGVTLLAKFQKGIFSFNLNDNLCVMKQEPDFYFYVFFLLSLSNKGFFCLQVPFSGGWGGGGVVILKQYKFFP